MPIFFQKWDKRSAQEPTNQGFDLTKRLPCAPSLGKPVYIKFRVFALKAQGMGKGGASIRGGRITSRIVLHCAEGSCPIFFNFTHSVYWFWVSILG